jgi:hypothetical protein
MRAVIAVVCAISLAGGVARAADPGDSTARLERWLAQLGRYSAVRLESYQAPTEYKFSRGSKSRTFRCAQDLWIVSARMEGGSGVTCRFAGRDPATCFGVAALNDEEALAVACPATAPAAPTAAVPPWLRDLQGLVADDVFYGLEPFDGGAAIRVALGSQDAHFAVKTASGWRLSPAPFRECDDADRGPWRLLEGGSSLAVIASCYSGGSLMGTLTTSLRVLARADLSTLGERKIGQFEWRGSRRTMPSRAAWDLWARPHVEILLEPSFLPDDRLRLRLARRSLERLSDYCTARERRLGRAVDNDDEVSLCPLPDLFDLQKAVGTWQPTPTGAPVRAP